MRCPRPTPSIEIYFSVLLERNIPPGKVKVTVIMWEMVNGLTILARDVNNNAIANFSFENTERETRYVPER